MISRHPHCQNQTKKKVTISGIKIQKNQKNKKTNTSRQHAKLHWEAKAVQLVRTHETAPIDLAIHTVEFTESVMRYRAHDEIET